MKNAVLDLRKGILEKSSQIRVKIFALNDKKH